MLAVTRYLVAGPATTTIAGDVPVSELLSVAVTAYDVPVAVPTVRVTVVAPLAFVVELDGESEPPVPVLVQVTVLPGVATALPFASDSCAVIVTAAPGAGELFEAVTTYFVAAGTVTVTVAVPFFPSLVAVIVLVPTATAVTRPVALTVATDGLLEIHAMLRPVSVVPLASSVVGVSCCVPPTNSDGAEGATVTVATAAAPSVMLWVADVSPLLPNVSV